MFTILYCVPSTLARRQQVSYVINCTLGWLDFKTFKILNPQHFSDLAQKICWGPFTFFLQVVKNNSLFGLQYSNLTWEQKLRRFLYQKSTHATGTIPLKGQCVTIFFVAQFLSHETIPSGHLSFIVRYCRLWFQICRAIDK